MPLGPSPSFADWILLPLRPWTLARVAAGAENRTALLVAGGTAFLLAVTGVAFSFGQISEPLADWTEYLGDVVGALPAAIFFALLLLFCGLLPFGFAVASGPEPGPLGPRREARARALLLNHVALLLPIAGLLAAVILAELGRPAFGLLAGKPAWLTSPFLQQLASAPVALLLLGVYVLNAGWAFRAIGRDGAPRG